MKSSSILSFLLLFSLISVHAQTPVSGPIASNTTWAMSNSPYEVTGNVTVNVGATLTVEPGVTVNFTNNNFDLIVDGVLIADGGPGADSIFFQNGGASVLINSASSNSIIDHVHFEDLGVFNIAALQVSGDISISNSLFVGCEVGVTTVNGASPTIEQCSFISSNDYAILMDDGSPTISNIHINGNNLVPSGGIRIHSGIPTITNSIIEQTGNSGGLWIDHELAPTIENNTFLNNVMDVRTHPMLLNDEFYDNNGLTDIHVDSKHITSNTTWHKPQSPESWVYRPVFGDITVDFGSTLTIEAGTEVVFLGNGQDLFIDGSLIAEGTVSDSIRLNNGFATIEFRAGSGPSSVEYVRVHGMGAFNIGALVVKSSDTEINNALFTYCEVGVEVNDGANPSIEECTFVASSDFGITVVNGSPTITNNHIDGNNLVPTGGIRIQEGVPNITNNTIENVGNSGGVWIDHDIAPILENNSFQNNTRDIRTHPMLLDDEYYDNNGIGNSLGVIHYDPKNITDNTTWHKPQAPENWVYTPIFGDLTIEEGNTLTIEPGVVIEFGLAQDWSIHGALNAVGTESDSIFFNGANGTFNFSASSESSIIEYTTIDQLGAFNIAGLMVSSDITIANCLFTECEIGVTIPSNVSPTISQSTFIASRDYAIQVDDGSASITDIHIDGNDQIPVGGIWIRGGSPSITNSTIEKTGNNGGMRIENTTMTANNITISNCRTGVMVLNDASPTLTDFNINNTEADGVHVESGSPTISNSCIHAIGDFGIQNEGTGSVTAADNWWGDATGPLHASDNPNGLGSEVTDGVTFDPWIVEQLCSTVSIEERGIADRVFVYPNPSEGLVHLSEPFSSQTQIEIYSLNGQSMASFVLGPNQTKINIADLPVGLYHLTLKNDDVQILRRILISR